MGTHEHAIVLLPAGIKQNPDGRWVSTDLTPEDDKRGAPGGKLRIFAAKELLIENPDAVLVTGGGLGYDIRPGETLDRPLLADIILDELRELGVDESRVIIERNSNSTYQELNEVVRLAEEYRFKELTFISNRYSLPRLKAMVSAKFSHLGNRAKLSFVSAEDVLIRADSKQWSEFVEDAYQSEYLKERMKREEHGIAQINDGTYQYK